MTQPVSLCLVGPAQQENLALQYLAASAEGAGFRTEILRFDSRRDMSEIVRRVQRHGPLVVGLSMAFQCSLGDHVELATVLRDRGYRGHLTAGGHVATFCWAQLLRDCPALDSIVLYEGEATLVEILRHAAAMTPASGIDGAAWRDEAGRPVLGSSRPPVADLDELLPPKRPPEASRVAGVPVAFMLTARGCIGECAYCCIRAFVAGAGGARYRLRTPQAVGKEAGRLSAEGVRVVFAQDDLFVLPDERRAVARMAAMCEACAQHGAGNMAWWVKGRPESVTPKVLEAARALGVKHLFLGIENPVAERLSYLGRWHRPEHNRQALELCREHGIKTSFNLMMFDPESPLEHVAAVADFAAENLDVPWNICRTEIYPGTELFSRLQAQGRLTGDYRGWGYRMTDARAELAFRILRVSLAERAFTSGSLLNKLISATFAIQTHEWLFPGVETQRIAARVAEIGRAARQDTVALIRRTIEFAARTEPESRTAINRFAVHQGLAVGQRDLSDHAEIDRLWDWLDARGRRALGVNKVA